MTNNYTTLNKLPLNQTGIVKEIIGDNQIKRRMLDLGIINGTEITALFQSPSGEPRAYLIKGATIALREESARQVSVQKVGK